MEDSERNSALVKIGLKMTRRDMEISKLQNKVIVQTLDLWKTYGLSKFQICDILLRRKIELDPYTLAIDWDWYGFREI